jgi:DNA-binding HxlR family transcriptional regulator
MAKAVVTCPVEEAIRVIGGKWKLLVLRSLLLNGPQRYNELLKTVTGISQKELTRNLREMASAGLVTGAYELTKLGKGLIHVQEVINLGNAPSGSLTGCRGRGEN